MPPKKQKNLVQSKTSKQYKVVIVGENLRKEGPLKTDEFETKLNDLAKEGWTVKSSDVRYIEISGVDVLLWYALMEK